ncbi:MAG: hypothetical protein ACFB00_09035 [Parvularculaceae bacterium]
MLERLKAPRRDVGVFRALFAAMALVFASIQLLAATHDYADEHGHAGDCGLCLLGGAAPTPPGDEGAEAPAADLGGRVVFETPRQPERAGKARANRVRAPPRA